ncbi:hypothetical protein [Eisenbergiella tayi]|uniref:hypothetical protein n=1 Tax=Eisenbergiella tayi TaxID=1432052 RepID=UPI0004BCF108|nr:hypothetical protein [Eisenbergiella tayi]
MELQFDNYILSYEDGGIEVRKNGTLLYFNRRPMFVTVKTSFAVSEFFDAAYEKAEMRDGRMVAEGTRVCLPVPVLLLLIPMKQGMPGFGFSVV